MSEVVKLETVARPISPVDAEVVKVLSDMLARAERGEFQGFVMVTIEADAAGSLVSAGSLYAGEATRQNVHAVIGGIESAKVRFIRERLD